MKITRVFLSALAIACFICFIKPAAGENYPLIIRGKVLMPNGSPPPFTVGIERVCSDQVGSAPGPLTNKKGEFLWRMDVDPMRTRSCVLRATHAGYTSTAIDISALNGYLSTTIDLEPIIINSLTDDPYAIIISESDMPFRARSATKAAMKALDEPNYAEAANQFQTAVEKEPKFALGWHALGVLLERKDSLKDAREAYEHAIQSNPRFLAPYMTLVRLCIKTQDWECTTKTADALIKADKKHNYVDIHLHRAVAQYKLNNLDEALASVQEALRQDPNNMNPRSEYVYGRILEAKGDIEGARQHMSRYLELDKKAPDQEKIKQHIQNLGKPGSPEPELEYL